VRFHKTNIQIKQTVLPGCSGRPGISCSINISRLEACNGNIHSHYNSYCFVPDDTKITSDEFIQDWLSRSLGTALEAHTLFHHLDVDRSGYISEDPDLPFIIHFFDRDCKFEILKKKNSIAGIGVRF